jgi:hypothetical protein
MLMADLYILYLYGNSSTQTQGLTFATMTTHFIRSRSACYTETSRDSSQQAEQFTLDYATVALYARASVGRWEQVRDYDIRI